MGERQSEALPGELAALILPPTLQELELWFDAFESAMPLLQRRVQGGSIRFEMLKASLELSRRKTFSQQTLGALLATYPATCAVASDDRSPPGLFVQPAVSLNELNYRVRTQRSADFRRALVGHIERCFEDYVAKGGKSDAFDMAQHVRPIDPVEMPGPGQIAPANDANQPNRQMLRVPLSVLDRQRRSRLPRESSAPKRRAPGSPDASSENENANRPEAQRAPVQGKRLRAGLRGLPDSLLLKAEERRAAEEQLAPSNVLARHRMQARASLPSFFDAVYLFFRTNRKTKCEMDKLVRTLVERRGPGAFSAVAGTATRQCLVREQLELLVALLPELCSVSDSKLNPGRVVFNMQISDGLDLGALRDRVRLGASNTSTSADSGQQSRALAAV